MGVGALGAGGWGELVVGGVQPRPLSLFPPIAIVPPLWPEAWREDVEEVCRQLELSERVVCMCVC